MQRLLLLFCFGWIVWTSCVRVSEPAPSGPRVAATCPLAEPMFAATPMIPAVHTGYPHDGMIWQSGHHCTVGSTCDFDCDDGGCAFTCDAGSICNADCAGGGCTLACESGATCNQSCDGGGCHTSCETGSTCNVDCDGGGCRATCEPWATCAGTCDGGGCS
jgi:hypothetical protein